MLPVGGDIVIVSTERTAVSSCLLFGCSLAFCC